MTRDKPMRFGVFLNPFHKLGLNPHLMLHRDVEIAQHLDRLGYDELWYGEHHSSATETIASPELMIASALPQTRNIRLGTGVLSLPYHNPFVLADRLVQLDHLARGRMMFGAGPGQLLQDAQMLGIDPATQRDRMEEALQIMVRLFAGERVTHQSDWLDLVDAELQHRPYSDFEIAVTAIFSPNGPKLAGRLGASMLTLGSTNPQVVDILADHWRILQTEAKVHGQVADRSKWRLLGQMFIADTMDDAIREVGYGLRQWLEHSARLQPGAEFPDADATITQLVDQQNESEAFVIGTPDMAIRHIKKLREKSGGFGCFLLMGAEYARWPATLRHYELIAEEVMPHFTGQLEPIRRAYDRVAASGTETAMNTARAQAANRAAYEREVGNRASPS